MIAPRRSIPYLVVSAVVLIGVIAAATAYLVAEFRERELRNAERELSNTALVVTEQLDRSFQSVELVQRSVLDSIAAEHVATSEELTRVMGTQDVHRMLADKISGLAHVDAVTLINAQGKLINFSRYWPIPEVNVLDRDYFKALQAEPSLLTFVSLPVHNRGNGTWTFFLARKIINARGDFLGVVLGAVELGYFEKIFGAIALGEGSSVSLYRGDGALLVRYPHVEASIGQVYEAGLTALGGNAQGTLRYRSKWNGDERLIAAHRLTHFPLYVTAARDIEFARRSTTAWATRSGTSYSNVLPIACARASKTRASSRAWAAMNLQLSSTEPPIPTGLPNSQCACSRRSAEPTRSRTTA